MKIRVAMYTLLMMLICNYLLVDGTFAWFPAVGASLDGNLEVGLVHYTKSGGLISSEDPIVPSQNLIDAAGVSVTNFSTVPTKLMIDIDCVMIDDLGERTHLTSSDIVEIPRTQGAASLVYNAEEDVYYYCDTNDDDIEIPAAVAQGGDVIPLLSELTVKENVRNYGNCILKITVTYYARQSRYMEWSQFAQDILGGGATEATETTE